VPSAIVYLLGFHSVIHAEWMLLLRSTLRQLS